MKKYLVMFCSLLLLACSYQASQHQYALMAYDDFGPPALASDLIGVSWWQWDNHGDSRPRMYPISVIVYRNIDLHKVKQLFPVVKEKRQDYRYVEYQKAIVFLNNAIKELEPQKDSIPIKMINKLIDTRNTLQFELGPERE